MATQLRILLSLLMIQLLCAAGALAGPSYWRAATSNPASDSWRDGITISFSLDENQCKKRFCFRYPRGIRFQR